MKKAKKDISEENLENSKTLLNKWVSVFGIPCPRPNPLSRFEFGYLENIIRYFVFNP